MNLLIFYIRLVVMNFFIIWSGYCAYTAKAIAFDQNLRTFNAF
ncbi:hypothetical protein PLUTE_a1441 [Pseudoalteromonas luteoviolacea DSM 6061]|nr:hypothetical protein [Pseudoalteromonas luteoviolacea DSM 6061]